MAALALGAIGAGVGSFFGYASVGWAVGSALGNYLFAPDQPDIQGPRLTDRSVSGSAYGTMRPILYGTYRMAGEIIWAADLKEHAKKEETGGKGGGGGGSYTTYTYSASFAIALCEGEITGVRKIWMDSKLVYTRDAAAGAGELQVSDKLARKIAFYNGTETQTADPTMQSHLGAANVPAYRGTAYIVFTDLWVTDYGNRIPQITVEVVADGALSLENTLLSSTYSGLSGSLLYLEDGVAQVSPTDYSAGGPNEVVYRLFSLDGTLKKSTSYLISMDGSNILASGENALLDGEEPKYNTITGFTPDAKYMVAQVSRSTGSNKRLAVLSGSSGIFTCIGLLATNNNLYNQTDGAGGLSSEIKISMEYASETIAFTVFLSHYVDGTGYRFDVPVFPPTNVIYPTWAVSIDDTRYGLNDTVSSGDVPHLCIDRASGDVLFGIKDKTTQTSIKRYTADGDFIEEKFIDVFATSSNGGISYGIDNGLVWVCENQSLKVYDWETETLVFSDASAFSGMVGGGDGPSGSYDANLLEVNGNLCIGLRNGVLSAHSIVLSSNSVTLSSVVSDICQRCGLDVGDIDVSDLASDNVRGYLIANQTPARSSLEQLSAAYFFDGRESDGVLEFVKRGDTPTVELDDDDLGCYEGDSVVELADAIRTQEEELPKSLTINYANAERDYQVGAQYSIRQSVLNGTAATIQLPISFTDDEAKSIVDKMMFSAWENRHKFTMRTWQSFCKLDPADVITARGETLRIITRNEGVNGIIELEAVRELPQIYTGQIGAGAPSTDTGQSVYVGGPTIPHFVDVPPLRDADAFGYGAYWIADGILDDWAGAALLRQSGSTYSVVSTSDDNAIAGYASTALGDFYGGNIFDESNVVRVVVSGTLETKTESEVLEGSNLALIGDELVPFKNATLVSTGVYDLSGLLRGRIGTDWAMSTHAVSDGFVLLTSTLLRRFEIDATDLDAARVYGTITYGKTVEDITTASFTYAGNNLKPLSPIEIGGGTSGINTAWTINWKRRTRYDWQWRDSVDAGEDESSNNFEVRIYNDPDTPATVVRTISVTDALTTTYSAANQAADFGAIPVRLAVSVRQIGAYRNSEWSDIQVIHSGLVTNSVLLLHFDGDNASTTFTDEYGNTVTANGNAQISTAQSKFGGASGLFDGTGDYLSIVSATSLQFATADFTIECFIRFTSLASSRVIIGRRSAATSRGMIFQVQSTGVLRFLAGDTNTSAYEVDISSSTVMSTNTWYHVAVTRQTNTFRIFINGGLENSSTVSLTIADQTSALQIGALETNTNPFIGNIDELRIKKGEALYTAAFTAPTAAFEN